MPLTWAMTLRCIWLQLTAIAMSCQWYDYNILIGFYICCWFLLVLCHVQVFFVIMMALQLIHNKANVNAVNEHGNTPLHYACFWGYDEVAEVCVDVK